MRHLGLKTESHTSPAEAAGPRNALGERMMNRGSAQPSTKGKKQILNTIFTWISLFKVNFAQKMDRAAATKWDPSRLEAGPVLDRLIELRVFGRKPFGHVPPYSTDDQAAERVASHLTRPPLRLMALKAGDGFICGWLSPSVAGTYVRLVSAAASSRALAICRAALAMVGPVEGEREERTLSRAWQLLTRGVRGSSNV